eukprot:scaffold8901_cov165-Skeletonema_marinoi.AAC.1
MVNLEMRSISIRAPHDDAKMRLGDGNTSSVMWSSSELGQDHRGLTRTHFQRRTRCPLKDILGHRQLLAGVP